MSILLLADRFIADMESYIAKKLSIPQEARITLSDLEKRLLSKCQSDAPYNAAAGIMQDPQVAEEYSQAVGEAASAQKMMNTISHRLLTLDAERNRLEQSKEQFLELKTLETRIGLLGDEARILQTQLEELEAEPAGAIEAEGAAAADTVDMLHPDMASQTLRTQLEANAVDVQLAFDQSKILQKHLGSETLESLEKKITENTTATEVLTAQDKQHRDSLLQAKLKMKQFAPVHSGPAKHAIQSEDHHHKTLMVCGYTLESFLKSDSDIASAMIRDMAAIDTSVLKSLCALWYIYHIKELSNQMGSLLEAEPEADLEDLMSVELRKLRQITQHLLVDAKGGARKGVLEDLLQTQGHLSEACTAFYMRAQEGEDRERVQALLLNCNKDQLVILQTDTFHEQVMKVARKQMLEYIQNNLFNRDAPESLIKTAGKKAAKSASILTSWLSATAAAAQPSDGETSTRKATAAVNFLLALDQLGAREADPKTYTSLLYAEFSRMCETVNGLPSYKTVRYLASFLSYDANDGLDKAYQQVRNTVKSLPGFQAFGLNWGEKLKTAYELDSIAATAQVATAVSPDSAPISSSMNS